MSHFTGQLRCPDCGRARLPLRILHWIERRLIARTAFDHGFNAGWHAGRKCLRESDPQRRHVDLDAVRAKHDLAARSYAEAYATARRARR